MTKYDFPIGCLVKVINNNAEFIRSLNINIGDIGTVVSYFDGGAYITFPDNLRISKGGIGLFFWRLSRADYISERFELE